MWNYVACVIAPCGHARFRSYLDATNACAAYRVCEQNECLLLYKTDLSFLSILFIGCFVSSLQIMLMSESALDSQNKINPAFTTWLVERSKLVSEQMKREQKIWIVI